MLPNIDRNTATLDEKVDWLMDAFLILWDKLQEQEKKFSDNGFFN